ncbi:MAG: FAD-dependent oxidoreductase [Opitutaceae bacterium]|nr:FAD-dependent oxidoreductase [Opitutaceae bacterium]
MSASSPTSHSAPNSRARVIVAGAGPSGIVAAIAAAREGAQTTLLEQNGFVGGVAGMGLGLQGFYDTSARRVIGGIPWEFVRRMIDRGLCVIMRNDDDPKDPFYLSRYIRFNPELFKRTATEMLLEAGVNMVVRSMVTNIVREGSRVTGVVVENKSGSSQLSADCLVDCTGDGDLAARAGAQHEIGSRGDGVLQPMTMLFFLSHVNVPRAEQHGVLKRQPWNVVEPKRLIGKINSYRLNLMPWVGQLSQAIPEVPRITGTNFHDYGNGIFHTGNFIHISHLDGSNGDQLAKAETIGRTVVWRLVEFLQRNVPGFENVNLVQIATHVGVRETRRIHGHYYLTVEDARKARQFADNVAQCGNLMDIHDNHASDYVSLASGTQIDGGLSFGMPYRCLVPQGVDALLMAGRCVSGSREAQSSFRVMGTCMAMGQAAGTAAALTALAGTVPRLIDPQALRARLVEVDAMVDSPGIPAFAAAEDARIN